MAALMDDAMSVERLTEVMRLVEYDMMHRRRDGDGFVGERKEVATIITALRHRLAHSEPRPVTEAIEPSLELCIQFSDDGQHIRKWSRFPFEGGECLYSHPATHSPAPTEAGEVERQEAVSDAVHAELWKADAEVERLREALQEAFGLIEKLRCSGHWPSAVSPASAAVAVGHQIRAALSSTQGGAEG